MIITLRWYWLGRILLLFFWGSILFLQVNADEHSHTYTADEAIVVWANSVGPKANNQETYSLYSLPYCQGTADITHYHETLGEALLGYRLDHTGINIKFKQDVKENTGDLKEGEKGSPVAFCTKEMDKDKVEQFKHSISNEYEYILVVDGIQVRVPVGDYLKGSELPSIPLDPKIKLFTHLLFNFVYNGDQIVGLEVIPSQPLDLAIPQTSIKFTYSVVWTENKELKFEDRQIMPKSDVTTGTKEYHTRWLAIGNSFLMVLFLVGVVSVILMRTLRKDFARYGRGIGEEDSELEALERDLLDDFGWKQVHGDVFRPPPNLMIISSALGSGTQICGVALAVLLFTIIGDWSFSRSKILTAGIFVYSILAILGGYSSARFYTSYGGKNWVHSAIATALAWPVCVVAVSTIINFIAIFLSSTRALPFTTILILFSIWLFLAVPLTLFGASLGRKAGADTSFPCRVNALPRPIPVKLWYQESYFMILAAGGLSFSSLFIELYYIFRAFWTVDAPYLMYGFFLLSFILLLILTSSLSIVTTYLYLNSEDHRWHWFSFLSGASTSLYVYLYAIYYFWFKTQMYGSFQIAFYFAYLALACLTLSIVLGTISTWATALFVNKIYATVKID